MHKRTADLLPQYQKMRSFSRLLAFQKLFKSGSALVVTKRVICSTHRAGNKLVINICVAKIHRKA